MSEYEPDSEDGCEAADNPKLCRVEGGPCAFDRWGTCTFCGWGLPACGMRRDAEVCSFDAGHRGDHADMRSGVVEALIARLVRERDEARRNLTSTQERCTALTLEVRELRRELRERS